MDEEKDSKTEEPTPKRLDDARKRGEVAKSQELNTFTVFFVSITFFSLFYYYYIFKKLIDISANILTRSSSYTLDSDTLLNLAFDVSFKMLDLLLPLFIVIVLTAIGTNIWQNDGFLLSGHPIMPKFNKISPLKGFKKIFGRDLILNIFKSLAKLLFILITIVFALKDELITITNLFSESVIADIRFLGKELFSLFSKATVAIFLISIIDLIYQKWSYKKNLMMTKKEVKDERREQEGDPFIKARLRERQIKLSRTRLLETVPKAEVVITNPTKIAVALKYKAKEDIAPLVVAKGRGLIAKKIKEIATEHSIFIMENKELARTLFVTVDVGDTIPEDLYKSVAEVLAYVYKLKESYQ